MSEENSLRTGVSRRRFIRGTGVGLIAGTSVARATARRHVFEVDSAKKLRIGVVGGGFGAAFPWHLHPNCEVTAVADLREDRRKRLVDTFKCSNVYQEFHAMLKDARVDAIAIFTGAPDHVPHCVDVMEAGKDVLCAVPAAVSLEQCQKLQQTVKRTGKIYMMAETSCFRAPTMTAREWRKRGKFGMIYHTSGEYMHNHGSYLASGTVPPSLMAMFIHEEKPTWRYGYAPGFYVTHATGPVIHVTGEKLVEVAAIGIPIDHPFYKKNRYNNPFINVTLLCKTSGGNSSQIAIHWWTAAPVREGADYYGTEACFFEPRFGGPAHVSYPANAESNSKREPLQVDDHSSILPPAMKQGVGEGHGGAEVFIVNEFVSACLEERTPVVGVHQALAYTAPGICGQESAMKNGAWIKVPDFGPID